METVADSLFTVHTDNATKLNGFVNRCWRCELGITDSKMERMRRGVEWGKEERRKRMGRDDEVNDSKRRGVDGMEL